MAGRIWAEVTALAYSACSSAACMCACGVDVGADSVSYFFPTWNFFLIDLCCPTVFADSFIEVVLYSSSPLLSEEIKCDIRATAPTHTWAPTLTPAPLMS
jgi:hypothetical protein